MDNIREHVHDSDCHHEHNTAMSQEAIDTMDLWGIIVPISHNLIQKKYTVDQARRKLKEAHKVRGRSRRVSTLLKKLIQSNDRSLVQWLIQQAELAATSLDGALAKVQSENHSDETAIIENHEESST